MSGGEVQLTARRSFDVAMWRLPRGGRRAMGLAAVLVGVALVVVGTAVMTHSTAWPRTVLVLIGLWLGWRGIDLLCRSRWGPQFSTGLWAAAIWVGALAILVILADLLPLESPGALPQATPSYLGPDLFSGHPLGTDGLGRDELSRVIFGARPSLIIGLGGTAAGLLVGTAIGMLAAYHRRWVDRATNLVTDSLLAFPPLVFLLALVATFRPSLATLFVAFGLLTVPTIVRLARAQTASVLNREYVFAARTLGATNQRVITREILPNIVPPLRAFAMVLVASLVIGEASLSFLGLGIQQPSPSWGNMIADAQNVLQQHPHTMLVPAVALFLTVTAFNRLGARARRERRSVLLR
jgi:peptide/nickel transport system permease protein